MKYSRPAPRELSEGEVVETFPATLGGRYSNRVWKEVVGVKLRDEVVLFQCVDHPDLGWRTPYAASTHRYKDHPSMPERAVEPERPNGRAKTETLKGRAKTETLNGRAKPETSKQAVAVVEQPREDEEVASEEQIVAVIEPERSNGATKRQRSRNDEEARLDDASRESTVHVIEYIDLLTRSRNAARQRVLELEDQLHKANKAHQHLLRVVNAIHMATIGPTFTLSEGEMSQWPELTVALTP